MFHCCYEEIRLISCYERRLRNLASGSCHGRCGFGADRVVGERSVKAEFAHTRVGLAFAVKFLA
jgi:hypothetical protein